MQLEGCEDEALSFQAAAKFAPIMDKIFDDLVERYPPPFPPPLTTHLPSNFSSACHRIVCPTMWNWGNHAVHMSEWS